MNKEKTTYNGWTNYATWRISLELFNDFEFEQSTIEEYLSEIDNLGAYYFSEYLQDLAEEWSTCNCENEIAKDYCLAFLAQVNYREIAEHILNDYKNYM